jgi:hypothetical protein
MVESILTSIKKLLGITEEYTHFDSDIIMHINTVFMTLNQLNVGPSGGFMIEDKTTTWDEYIDTSSEPDKLNQLSAVKSYMHLKVKLLFDPPLGSAVMESMNRMINELEWRLNAESDYNNQGGETNGA